jgi:hypothetical protein
MRGRKLPALSRIEISIIEEQVPNCSLSIREASITSR